MDAVIHATGHAHIDVAWLWTLGQTHRKSERTFHNVIRLMEQFPDYHFSQIQPQLYQFIKEDQPALFEVHQTENQRRTMGADGRHVGRSGLQSERRGIIGTAISSRSHILPRTFRQGCRDSCVVAARCLRLCMGVAATHQQAGLEIFHDHQDRLESIQPPAL